MTGEVFGMPMGRQEGMARVCREGGGGIITVRRRVLVFNLKLCAGAEVKKGRLLLLYSFETETQLKNTVLQLSGSSSPLTCQIAQVQRECCEMLWLLMELIGVHRHLLFV